VGQFGDNYHEPNMFFMILETQDLLGNLPSPRRPDHFSHDAIPPMLDKHLELGSEFFPDHSQFTRFTGRRELKHLLTVTISASVWLSFPSTSVVSGNDCRFPDHSESTN
jgi:hypothetical protein